MSCGVYLALSFKNKTLGAAFYDEGQAYVYYMPDVFEDDGYSQLRMLIEDVRPTNVIASCAQDAGFLKALRTICNFNAPNATKYDESVDDAGGDDEPEAAHFDVATGYELSQPNGRNLGGAEAGSAVPVYDGAAVAAKFNAGQEVSDVTPGDDGGMIVSTTATDPEEADQPEEELFSVLHLMPAVAFSEDECKTRVTELFHGFGDGQSSMAAGFRIDFSSVNTIRAFGALLRFLSQQRIGVEFDDITEKTPIKGIRAFHLEHVMLVDATTLKALQVFESEYNPQAIKQKKTIFGRQFREGVSIFNLCNVCKSVPGKQMLKRWFRRPTTDRALLIDRHSAISYFYQDCNLEVGRTIRNYLRNVSNVRGTLRRVRSGTATISDWTQIYKTASSLSSIFDYVRNMNLKLTATKDVKLYTDDIMRIGALISEIMDIEGSRAEGRFVVRDGIDDELDVLKLKYLSLPESLTIIAQAEAESYDVDSCSVGYLPIIGYLLVLPEDMELSPDAQANLELIYTADGESHYKSPRMRELDTEIGDIKMQIVDFEKTIVINLQTLILKRANSLCQGVEVAAHLDCLLSLAAVAREYDWHRPKLVDEAIIDVTNARHPLAEMITTLGFVRNPIKSGGNYSKVKLISGPNASGKSVYLKMIGIIAYMASIGSFVPAESATIGPINRIISRMYTIDSVLDGMSSFANDLRQMSDAVCSSDEHSLVIMDEFGKGTMTEVGLSLLASCMNYWLAKGRESCPHVFASSHFHVLPTLLINADFLSCHTMDIKYTSNTEIDFFYKLVDGSIDNSYASYAARKNGISEEIMERADAVYKHLNSGHLIIDVPKTMDDTIDAENYILSERMDSIIKEFSEFDLRGDPMGFMKLAISVLDPDDGHEAADVTPTNSDFVTPTRRVHSQEEVSIFDPLVQFPGFATEPPLKRPRLDVTPFANPVSAPPVDSSENSVQDAGANNSVAENVDTETAEAEEPTAAMSSSKRFSKAPSAKRLIKKPLRPAETTMVKASNSISARFKEEIFRANSPLPTSSNNQNPYGFLDNEEYKEELVSVEVEMEQYDDVNASTAGPFHSSNLTSMNSSNLSSFNGSYLSSINGSAPHSLNGSFLSSIHAGSNQNSFDENRRLSHAGDLDSVDNGLSFDELGDDDDVSELKFDKNRRLRMSSPATLHEHLEHALNDHRASNEILGLEDEFEERMQIANDSTVMAHGENDENADISGNGGAPGKSHDAMDDDMM